MALLPAGPAIDAGSNFPAVDPISGQSLTTDQRGAGFVRALNGGIDIGAYELQPGTVSTVSVRWGSSGLATLQTASDGLRLLPAGRHTDLPWTGIKGLIITFDEPVELLAADVTVSSLRGVQYGPVKVKGPFYATGSTDLPLDGPPAEDEYDILFAQPIAKPDRITITITSAVGLAFLGEVGIVPYTRRLDVLPGDFYDTGVVTSRDITAIHNEASGKNGGQPTIFGEIMGDGTVNASDYKAARKFQGDRLPKLPKTGGKPPKVVLSRLSPFAPRKEYDGFRGAKADTPAWPTPSARASNRNHNLNLNRIPDRNRIAFEPTPGDGPCFSISLHDSRARRSSTVRTHAGGAAAPSRSWRCSRVVSCSPAVPRSTRST